MSSVRIGLGLLLVLGGFAMAKSGLPDWLAWTGILIILGGVAMILNPRGIFQREGQRS